MIPIWLPSASMSFERTRISSFSLQGKPGVVMEHNLAEPLGKGDLIFRPEILVPETQYLVIKKGPVDCSEDFVAHLLRQIQPQDFGPEWLAQSVDLKWVACSHNDT